MWHKETICYEAEKVTRVIAYLEDFDGDVAEWKDAFYELWRWQMTFSFAYEIMVNESRKNGVFVCLVLKRGYAESVLSAMEDLGYRNVKTFEETAAMVDVCDFGEDDDGMPTFAGVYCE